MLSLKEVCVGEWLENPDYAELRPRTPRKPRVVKTEVVLVSESDGEDSRRIWATLSVSGDLVIEGQDIGPLVERVFGGREYEFAYNIPAEYVMAFLETLGATNVRDVLNTLRHFGNSRYPEIAHALEVAKKSMPITFWSRF